jgi:tetratricopeptide (TPR) repeat protein
MAEELFFKANEFATTPAEKSEVLLLMGALKADQGQKVAARTMYQKAVEADPAAKEAYNNIGILYFTSYEQCKQGKSKVDDRAVFLLAYDMFMRGGNGQMAAQAKEQFPSKTEIFEENREAGDKISLGCWIGQSTTIRTRD